MRSFLDYTDGCILEEEIHELIEEDFESSGDEVYEDWDEITEEAEHGGRKVKLGNPFLTPGGPKKRAVYVKNDKGNVVKVNFGDPNMQIKRDNPARRRSYRARHNCANPGPRWKANYWSCKFWSSTPVSKLDEDNIQELSVAQGTTGKRTTWNPPLQGIRMADGTIKKLPPGKSGSSGGGGAGGGNGSSSD